VGRALEERAKLRTSADMVALQDLVPSRARLQLAGGGWAEVRAPPAGPAGRPATQPTRQPPCCALPRWPSARQALGPVRGPAEALQAAAEALQGPCEEAPEGALRGAAEGL
jgi:hypothetical protein